MSPITSGVLLALAAAICFGVTTPLVQRLAAGSGAFTTASVLYAGAALYAVMAVRRSTGGPSLRGHFLVILAAMAVIGAFVAPVCLAWGLGRTSGTSASLMLNVEAVFTVALGALINREHIGGRVWAAVAAIAGGGALLLVDRGWVSGAEALGLLAVAGATLAWACDNTLSRRLADHDPNRVVLGKGLLGASISASIAVMLGEPMPALGALSGLLACGMVGYGLSLRFYLLAQRRLGSARTGSVFATAPFIGAGVAWLMGEPMGGWASLAAVLLMAFGIYLHLTEHSAELTTPAGDPSASNLPGEPTSPNQTLSTEVRNS